MINNETDKNELFSFPGSHHFKIVGSISEKYRSELETIFREVLGEDSIKEISTRLSGKGNYMAYTIEAHVHDHSQLEIIHQKCTALPETKLCL